MELLAERQTARGMDRLISQFKHAHSGIARMEALDSLTAVFADEQNWTALITKALGDPFHEVRGLAVSRIPQLMAKDDVSPELEGTLVKLAESDPNNEVRSTAIALLGTLSGSKYASLFARMIEEPSYVVAGGALTALMDLEGEEAKKMEIFERFKGEKNIRMVVPLADYLTQIQDSSQSAWFNEKLDLLTGESLYYFIGYYGDYFASVGGTDKNEAIERLMRLAEDHPANYVRLTAFQSIFGFIDEGDILKRVIKINQNETDELVRSYQEFFLEPYLDEN